MVLGVLGLPRKLGTTIAILSCLHDSFVSGAEITTGNVAFANKRNGRQRDSKLEIKVEFVSKQRKKSFLGLL